MAYHAWTFLRFKPNDQGQCHIYIKVYDNVPIFGRWVHICMVNNVYDGSLQLLWTEEPFSIFQVAEMFFLWTKYGKYAPECVHPNFHTNWTMFYG